MSRNVSWKAMHEMLKLTVLLKTETANKILNEYARSKGYRSFEIMILKITGCSSTECTKQDPAEVLKHVARGFKEANLRFLRIEQTTYFANIHVKKGGMLIVGGACDNNCKDFPGLLKWVNADKSLCLFESSKPSDKDVMQIENEFFLWVNTQLVYIPPNGNDEPARKRQRVR